MEKVKIIHCADLHLGAELSALGERAAQRRQELLINFFRIVDLCKEEHADALLIAGDFFEGAGRACAPQVKAALGEIPDTVVAIAPGNHDYFCADSPYADEDWPSNTLIFRSGLDCAEFPEKRLRLWGAAFTETYVTAPLLTSAAVPKDNLINICVLHGELVSEGQPSNYNPVTLSQIGASGMDYIALGHIHKRSGIEKRGSTYYAYPGCPEGKGFDELGEKGVYAGTVWKGGVELAFRPLCRRMNLEARADISGAGTDREAAGMAFAALREAYGERCREHLYKLTLTGTPREGYAPDCGAIARLLTETEHLYYCKAKNGTRPALDLAALAKESSLKGFFVRRMLDKMSDAKERAQYERALHLGLKAFDGEVPYED